MECNTAATHSTGDKGNSEGSGQRSSVAALLVMLLVMPLVLPDDPFFVGFCGASQRSGNTSASDQPHIRALTSSCYDESMSPTISFDEDDVISIHCFVKPLNNSINYKCIKRTLPQCCHPFQGEY
ncbi:unnamed protein product [Euphydryas editha]|uniref:Uncharacterized protein n=1 Tax=Euphydryas editha TaxID=104508 RepID=A0AAU9U828_EUPED|nr:unnamed protein product [Euphydryas editha]